MRCGGEILGEISIAAFLDDSYASARLLSGLGHRHLCAMWNYTLRLQL
jgi:hypothetical protein